MSKSLAGPFLSNLVQLWQLHPVNADKFHWLAQDYGLRSSGKDVTRLWQLGILRADYVIHDTDVGIPGLVERTHDNSGRRVFSDDRHVTEGVELINVFVDLPPPPENLELFFHPFRLYVLYNFERRMKVGIHPLQVMMNADGLQTVTRRQTEAQTKWGRSDDFASAINEWNLTADYTVLAEPCFYTFMSGIRRYGTGLSWEEFDANISRHWSDIEPIYSQLGETGVQKYRESVAWSSRSVEPNASVHTLVRFTNARFRERLKGKLGLAIEFWTISEILRRAVEEATGTELPEEDDMLSSVPHLNYKERDFGSARIFDGNRRAVNEFLRNIGLDYSVRVRWYVEGKTEYGALVEAFDHWHQVQVINLAGQFSEGKRKGLAFRDSLRSDKDAGIFSFILLDGDSDENRRMVRRAAEKDEFVGIFLISEPDIERGNFTDEDVEVIIRQIAEEKKIEIEDSKLWNAIRDFESGDQLIERVNHEFPRLLSKGKDWGRRLMKHATENYGQLLENDTLEDVRLPLLQAIRITVQALSVDFHYHKTHFRTDPGTGRLVKRNDNPGP